VEITLSDGSIWRPADMGSPSGEPMTLRDGLVYSKNTITAQVAQDVGIPRIVALAKAMGVDQSRLDPVPSLALGTSPVTLLEMVTAYSTIAQQGQYHKPVLIRRISDRHGSVLAEFATETHRAMSADSAADLTDMLRGVVNRGTGTQIKSRFGIASDVAGKTGTTQNNTDGWFILMHPGLVAGAWVGFNDSRVTMRSNYWGQGGHNAILVVGDFFRSVQKAGLVNAKARFAAPHRPPPPPVEPPVPPSVDGARMDADPPGATGPTEIIIRQDANGSLVIGDKASVTTSRRAAPSPKSAEELDRALQGMQSASEPLPEPPPPPPPAQ
jgi:penicillin-binding protein 1A